MDINEIIEQLITAQRDFIDAMENEEAQKQELKHALESIYQKNIEMNKIIKEYGQDR